MITNNHLELAKFASTGDERFSFPGIKIDPGFVQATNGKGVIRHDTTGKGSFEPFVLCAKKALAIAKQSDGEPMAISDDRIAYTTKEGLCASFPIGSVRLAVDFPNCEKIWPTEDVSEEFSVDLDTLASVLDHMRKTCKSARSNKGNGVTFRFRSGGRVVEIVNQHSTTIPKVQAILARNQHDAKS